MINSLLPRCNGCPDQSGDGHDIWDTDEESVSTPVALIAPSVDLHHSDTGRAGRHAVATPNSDHSTRAATRCVSDMLTAVGTGKLHRTGSGTIKTDAEFRSVYAEFLGEVIHPVPPCALLHPRWPLGKPAIDVEFEDQIRHFSIYERSVIPIGLKSK